MKKKKPITYCEDIFYSCEFRVRQPMSLMMPTKDTNLFIMADIDLIPTMPCIITGWVQDEVHLQWSYQSLQ